MIGPRKVNKPLVLYGYGKLGHLAEEIFNELHIPIAAIIDNQYEYNGVLQFHKDNLLAVCVASEPYQPIHDSLKAAGWTDIVPVWDILDAYADQTGIHNGFFASIDDEPHIIPMKLWADEQSRNHYWWFGAWRILRMEGPLTFEPKKALPSTLDDIRTRQNNGRYCMLADFPMEKIFVHAEGYELDFLKRNFSLLQKRRPTIFAACYHSRDGLWKIPKFLMDNLERYRFYFRLHAYQGQGAYIYCIPEERDEKV